MDRITLKYSQRNSSEVLIHSKSLKMTSQACIIIQPLSLFIARGQWKLQNCWEVNNVLLNLLVLLPLFSLPVCLLPSPHPPSLQTFNHPLRPPYLGRVFTLKIPPYNLAETTFVSFFFPVKINHSTYAMRYMKLFSSTFRQKSFIFFCTTGVKARWIVLEVVWIPPGLIDICFVPRLQPALQNWRCTLILQKRIPQENRKKNRTERKEGQKK